MTQPYVLDYAPGSAEFTFKFPFNPDVVAQIKAQPTRRWAGASKRWCIPAEAYRVVEEIALTNGFQITPSADEALARLAERAKTGDPNLGAFNVVLAPDGTSFLLRVPYDKVIVDKVHQIPGKKWDAKTKAWVFPFNAGDFVHAVCVDDLGLTCSPEALTMMGRINEQTASMIEASSSLSSEPMDIPGFLGDPLKPYQWATVRYVERANFSCFIGDRPRVGKSFPALGAVALADHILTADCWPLVLISPPIAAINWQRYCTEFLPGKRSEILKGVTPRFLDGGFDGCPDIIIVNWAIVAAWAKHICAIRPGAFLGDELHRAKNPRAARSKAAYAIAQTIPAGQPRLGLTGTAAENSYKEMEYQIKIIGRHDQFGGKNYKKKWRSNVGQQRLHELLRSTCYIRREREAATGIVDPERSIFEVAGDPKVMVDYRDAEANVIEYLAQQARKKAAELGDPDPESAAVMAAMKAGGAAHLVAIGVLRQLAAKAKIPQVIEFGKRWVAETDDSLIVYAYHRAVIEAVADALNAPKIYGGDSATKRQAVLDGFLAKRFPIVIVSIPTAGEAIRLDSANDELFLEQAWHPSALRQAEDRACHIDKPGVVINAEYWATEGTIDFDMLSTIEQKREGVDIVLDGGAADAGWDAKGSVAMDLLERLTRRALKSTSATSGRVKDPGAWLRERAAELDAEKIAVDANVLDLDDLYEKMPLPDVPLEDPVL